MKRLLDIWVALNKIIYFITMLCFASFLIAAFISVTTRYDLVSWMFEYVR